ncbi:rhodanese-like domain-containing protein, partial [Bombilactobacillus bombi]|uniref:rhodanese-like domain-containing protein n=1 Tax=Bombilactobacillus bombi TaxID=1303590 RepID=UPI0015E60E9A
PDDLFLIDVRNAPNHLKKEKIINAILIPLNELENRLNEIPKNKKIIVYCWDVWCNMGAKAALILLDNNYNVKELSGGIAAWNKLNMQTVSLT